MKAHLIDTHLVPRSRSSAKVKVKYQGHVSHKMGVSGALVFHKHILFSLQCFQKTSSSAIRTGLFCNGSNLITPPCLQSFSINPFPHDKILGQTKLKAFADDKLNVTKMVTSVFDRVENIVGNGEIACTSNFSFSHNVFKRLLSQTCQRVSLHGNELNLEVTLFTIIIFFDYHFMPHTKEIHAHSSDHSASRNIDRKDKLLGKPTEL